MVKAKEEAEKSLQDGSQSYLKAATYLEEIDQKMAKTIKTRAISDKLKQLEAQKRAWQDGIRYSQNYQRFNDEKLREFII
jgi:hypothetical protein